jgi:hypothetical protein
MPPGPPFEEMPPPLAAPPATPSTPPGFAPPGQVPTLNGQPLASPRAGGRGLLAVAAFFALLLVVSIGGAVLYFGGRVHSSNATEVEFGGDFSAPPFTVSAEPEPIESAAPTLAPRPVTLHGTGDRVVRFPRGAAGMPLVYVKARPASDGYLAVYPLDTSGNKVGLVVTAFDAYEGVRVLSAPFTRVSSLEVHAAGAWTIQLRPASAAPLLRGSARGTGDTVLRYDGGGGVATISGGAPQKVFSVKAYVNDVPRLVVTSLGAYRGEKPFPVGPFLVEVQSPGAWSITVR